MNQPDFHVTPLLRTSLLALIALAGCAQAIEPATAPSAGDDAGASCPAVPFASSGEACSVEGQTCGPCFTVTCGTIVCGECHLLVCRAGHWAVVLAPSGSIEAGVSSDAATLDAR